MFYLRGSLSRHVYEIESDTCRDVAEIHVVAYPLSSLEMMVVGTKIEYEKALVGRYVLGEIRNVGEFRASVYFSGAFDDIIGIVLLSGQFVLGAELEVCAKFIVDASPLVVPIVNRNVFFDENETIVLPLKKDRSRQVRQLPIYVAQPYIPPPSDDKEELIILPQKKKKIIKRRTPYKKKTR